MDKCNNANKKLNVDYGPVQAKTYERDRQATYTDAFFWEREKQELAYAIKMLQDPLCTILEAGCGTGRFLSDLAKRRFYSIHGIDVSQYMLSIAHKKMRKRSLSFNLYRADISHLPFRNNLFDLVYCIRVINQLPSKEHAFSALFELMRVCKNHGLILIEYVNEWGLSRFSRTASTYFSIRDVQKNLSNRKNFKIAYVHGLLFFSQSLWKILPLQLFRLVAKLDMLFCKLLPKFSTRCYVLICKQEDHKRLI